MIVRSAARRRKAMALNQLALFKHFHELPKDIQNEVLNFLSLEDLSNFAQASKQNHQLAINAKLKTKKWQGTYSELLQGFQTASYNSNNLKAIYASLIACENLLEENQLIHVSNLVGSFTGIGFGGGFLIAAGILKILAISKAESLQAGLLLTGAIMFVSGIVNLLPGLYKDTKTNFATTGLVKLPIRFFQKINKKALMRACEDYQQKLEAIRELSEVRQP